MKFNYIADGIDAVVIDDFYNTHQLEEIMTELKWLTKPSVMRPPEHLSSASDGKTLLTSKKGVFLETIFANWEHSSLIKYPIENFKNQEVVNKLLDYNSLFRILFHCESRTHLLSYYENSDFYRPHIDNTVFTILNYFFTEPKQFSGGDITLYSGTNKKQADIEIKNNRVVLIPGCTSHEVKEITSNLKNNLGGGGRYCNAIFLNLRGDPPKKDNNDSN